MVLAISLVEKKVQQNRNELERAVVLAISPVEKRIQSWAQNRNKLMLMELKLVSQVKKTVNQELHQLTLSNVW